MSLEEFLSEAEEGQSDTRRGSLRAVGRALNSRWMMAFAVLSVLGAIAWAMQSKKLRTEAVQAAAVSRGLPSVRLLGVPAGSAVTVDGRLVEGTNFAVSPRARHAVEVQAPDGRSWRQVLQTDGPLTLLVDFEQIVAAASSRAVARDAGLQVSPAEDASAESTNEAAVLAPEVIKPQGERVKPRVRRRRAKPTKPAAPAEPTTPAEPAPEEDPSLIRDPGF